MKHGLFRGFTLIELMVVVAIIAILTALILPDLAGSKGKARDSQRISDVGQLSLALELYFDRCGTYPSSLVITANNGCPSATPAITFGTYIAQIPTPPTGGSYDYATMANSTTGIVVSYVLHTTLESTNAGVNKSLNASAIPVAPTGYAWTPSNAPSVTPYSLCSSTAGSVNYCIGPN